MPLIRENDRVLFIGDSVTDAGRDQDDPTHLGTGYVRFIADALRFGDWKSKVTVLNRGISGNRIEDLKQRWTTDCLDLKPDVVSVLIGINDTWRRYDRGQITTVAAYEADYRNILDRARAESDIRLVLIEPFMLSIRPEQDEWREDLDPRIRVVRTIADEYQATLVQADLAFQKAAQAVAAGDLADDGVHPSFIGHRLLAAEWLRAVGLRAAKSA